MFHRCSDGSCGPGGIWWSFQMKVWTLKIQRNPMIPNYSMIPAAAIRWSPSIRWSPATGWSPAIRWSIRSMDFDSRKVYGDTSITDGLVFFITSYFFFPFPFPFPAIPTNNSLWFPFPKCGNVFFVPFPFPNFGNVFFITARWSM